MASLLLVAFSIGFASLLLNWWLKLRRFSSKLNHVLGPKPLPLVGNALDLMPNERILPALTKYRDNYGGGLTKVSIGMDRMVVVAFDYKFLETVFNSMKIIEKAPDYKQFHRWLGLGLLTSSGGKWQQRRKLITPSFHFQILENFIEVFNSASSILVDQLRKEANGQVFNIYPYVTLCTLDVICESAMGIKVNAQENNDSNYVNGVKEMGRIVMERSTHPLKQHDFFYYMSRDYRKELKHLKVLHNTTDTVIKKRRDELLKNDKDSTSTPEEVNEVGSKRKLAFLDMLLKATTPDGKNLSNADVREEVDTFMFEGHDTTSAGISFTFLLLSKHPEIQQKVYEEITSILGEDRGKAPSYRDLQEMKYLELVINESLRLYPPVPIFGRELSEDLVFDGHVYPKGLSILIPAYCMHRDARYFPDPDKFDPERFSPENKIGRKPFSYFPFSAGPRNCIGQKFAILEMKSAISKVVRNYELSEVSGFEPVLSSEAIMKSLNGVQVRIRERKQ